MAHQQTTPVILRMKQVHAQTGLPKSTIYDHIGRGLFTRPIKFGERISGWIEAEVSAIIGARIAGSTDDDIKALVIELEGKRTQWGQV